MGPAFFNCFLLLQWTWHCRDGPFRSAPTRPRWLRWRSTAVCLLHHVHTMTHQHNLGGRSISARRWPSLELPLPTRATRLMVSSIEYRALELFVGSAGKYGYWLYVHLSTNLSHKCPTLLIYTSSSLLSSVLLRIDFIICFISGASQKTGSKYMYLILKMWKV